jgi:hypothetical protein
LGQRLLQLLQIRLQRLRLHGINIRDQEFYF